MQRAVGKRKHSSVKQTSRFLEEELNFFFNCQIVILFTISCNKPLDQHIKSHRGSPFLNRG